MTTERVTPDSPNFWSPENRIAREMAKAHAEYEIRMWKAIGEPKARREDVPTDFLKKYDWLHSPSTPQSSDEVTSMMSAFESIDGPKPSLSHPDGAIGSYLGGLIHSLVASIDDDGNPIAPEENRPRIIKLLADCKADEISLIVGMHGEDFMRNYPNQLDFVKGFIAGYEWVLGLRKDLGVDIQAEIDKFPNHPLRTPTTEAQA
jgi:hypothetical protein